MSTRHGVWWKKTTPPRRALAILTWLGTGISDGAGDMDIDGRHVLLMSRKRDKFRG